MWRILCAGCDGLSGFRDCALCLRRFPVEETVGALEDLVREGKIRTYGLSNSQPADLAAYRRVGGKVSVVQEFFSILSPFHGREYFEMCRKNNTVFQTYGVLEEGFLTSPAFLDKEFAKTDIRSRLPWVAPEKKEGLRRAFALWGTDVRGRSLQLCDIGGGLGAVSV